MQVKVHMLAFYDEPDKKRIVTIPDGIQDKRQLLESVFYNGQNEIQPQGVNSVSIGDVVDVDGEYWMVAAIGFNEMDPVQFLDYQSTHRDERFKHKARGII